MVPLRGEVKTCEVFGIARNDNAGFEMCCIGW